MADEDVLVIDLGSGIVKGGWAGEEQPRSVQPNVVARVKKASSGQPGLHFDEDLLTGSHAIRSVAEHPDALELTSPIDRGQITDWNGVTQALEALYHSDLHVESDRCSVLVSESPFASPKQREKLADLFFRQFRVPALLIYNSAVLSLFSSGLTTGLILESGESFSYAVPIFEGFALRHGVQKMEMGGVDITAHMMKLLNMPHQRLDVAREIKEKFAVIRPRSGVESNLDSAHYELPDGETIEIPNEARFATGDLLFQNSSGVDHLVFNAVEKCDSDLRSTMLANVVTAGDTTLMTGFHDRLTYELNTQVQSRYPGAAVNVVGKHKHASWVGGSMLASLSTFADLKITRHEFEDADDIVHKKYF